MRDGGREGGRVPWEQRGTDTRREAQRSGRTVTAVPAVGVGGQGDRAHQDRGGRHAFGLGDLVPLHVRGSGSRSLMGAAEVEVKVRR